MEALYIVAIIVSGIGAILAWLAKLKWSKEFGSAKDATINAKDAIISSKDAQIQNLKTELDNLRELNSIKIREYFISTKEQLEEYNDKLQQELNRAKAEADRLSEELEKRATLAGQNLQATISELELSNSQRIKIETAVNSDRLALTQVIGHEMAQPVFSALASIEFLRRKKSLNKYAEKNELFEYYLLKNIESSLKMVAFLNDTQRINEKSLSYSDNAWNLGNDVLEPVLNMIHFRIYETFLRDSDKQIEMSNVGDIKISDYISNEKQFEYLKTFDGTKYKIICDKAIENVKLYVDRYRLQSVFYALLDNALKFRNRSADCHVEIRACNDLPSISEKEHVDGFYKLEICDYGIGVDAEGKEKIFDLFYRSVKNKDHFHVGSGRGLYVCKMVLRSIGGDIVLSKLKNPTTFQLLIPRTCADLDWHKSS